MLGVPIAVALVGSIVAGRILHTEILVNRNQRLLNANIVDKHHMVVVLAVEVAEQVQLA